MSQAITNALIDAIGTKSPSDVRNVCLIAHVDHGKTSFADSLVSANAIISNRMAGKLRFMDSRDDEQTRGITMKASGVSLLCPPLLINLMDSPGHIDFSSEVSSALLLSDTAFLLVDVIEGVCSQTQALLRQAILNGQTVILVINKIDRLCVELKMSPSESYSYIQRLIEAVNGCVSQVLLGLTLDDESWSMIEGLEARLHFDPVKGTVIFSSATHGYAFGVEDFAELYATKLGVKKSELTAALFGDFYFAAGQIKPDAYSKGKRSLFEQLILEPLWSLHDCGLIKNDLPKLIELAGKIGIDVKSKRVAEAFDEIMRRWLPLHRACFRCCSRAPSAKDAFAYEYRLNHLLANRQDHSLRNIIRECDPKGPTVAVVVKFLPSNSTADRVAICRLLSGTLRKGERLCVSGKKVRSESEDVVWTEVSDVFMLRGRETIAVPVATAGVICAIRAPRLVQNATLCSEELKEGLSIGMEIGESLVRVTVNTDDVDMLDELREQLKLLSLLDPSLKVLELETGELAMVTAGEVHLQKCVKDLEDLGILNLQVSQPIVPFLETVIADPANTQTMVNELVTECRLRGDGLYLKVRAAPLPDEVVTVLEKSAEVLKEIRRGTADQAQLDLFKTKLVDKCVEVLPGMKGSWWFKKSEVELRHIIDKIWSFGPDRARANILINNIENYDRKSVWDRSQNCCETRSLDAAIVSGFELFTGAGPLCHEIMRGVVIIVEDWTVNDQDVGIAGQLISAVRATCKVACEKLGLRLVAAMYRCTISTASQALGKVHAVLSQRKAKVMSEDINEATGLFEVVALMPVVESFAFCDSLRKNTSGLASAQLHFSHWQLIDEDPYWQPSTQDEMEEFGVKGDSPNHARFYMDQVRRRKGLPTEDLIVVSAEKQRNLKKNK